MDRNDIKLNISETTPVYYAKPTSKDYLKALAYGILTSFLAGVALGIAIWCFESIYEVILVLIPGIVSLISRRFLKKPHQWLTMLICALVAFVCPLSMYFTMELLEVVFENEVYIYILMILSPLFGLTLGYIKTK